MFIIGCFANLGLAEGALLVRGNAPARAFLLSQPRVPGTLQPGAAIQ